MQDELRLHGALIGQPGSRRALNTPALVLDRDGLDRNIAKMAVFAAASGVRLRPHAKTHKSADIARRQLAAGAIGLCCAKLGEAEALASAVDSILITSPVVTPAGIARLVQLAQRLRELMVVVDHPDNVAALAGAAGSGMLSVLIDVDPGIKRTGVGSPEAAVALFDAIARRPQLRYRGVQFYCGLQQHIASWQERQAAIRERSQYLRGVVQQLQAKGGEPEIITGAGTGTHRIDAELGLFTEWQVGSYVFMDRQYAACQLAADAEPPFEHTLFVDARVVSANTAGIATTDAGFKALATDAEGPTIVSEAPADTSFLFMGDEHGALIDPRLQYTWQLGELVQFVVPHCDPTVNLYDAYHVVSGDTLVEIWPVTARGRSR